MEQLSEKKMQARYRSQVENKCSQLDWNESTIEGMWNRIKGVLQAAGEVLGQRGCKKKVKWFTRRVRCWEGEEWNI